MALFNRRNKNKEVLPQEVREYYQAEKRDRTGMAWLLAITTLVVTFLIAAGLFFGGRWAYRAIFDNDDKSGDTTSQTETAKTDQSEVKTDTQDTNGTPDAPATSSSNPTDSGSTSGGQTSSTNTSTPPAATGSVSGTSTTSPTSTTPAANPEELVNTGPGTVLSLAFVVTIAGALAHRYVWIRNKL